MRIVIFFIVALLFSSVTHAQKDNSLSIQPDSTRLYKIELNDGSVYLGGILKEDIDVIAFKTLSGNKIEIRKVYIKNKELVEKGDFKNGVYWFRNPNPTRYLFGPSAFNLKAGEGYYQNTYLLLNSFNYGITDNISVGGGVELITLFSFPKGGPIFILTPKVGFEVAPKFNVGGGVLYLSVPDFFSSNRTGLGIAYGVATYGTENSNITGGIGWGFVEGDFSSTPVITISGIHRMSRKTALVSENWLIPNGNTYAGIYSYGIRFFGEKLAVDLAFLNNQEISSNLTLGIPYVDFVVKF